MVNGFSEEWAHSVVARLTMQGVEFAPGLDDKDLDLISEVFGVVVPEELALLLCAGVPTSPKWARWTAGPAAVAETARTWIDSAFEFGIVHGRYWHASFGERPANDADAVVQALEVVHDAPPLLPVYAHRFLTTSPAEGPRAVLSVWQPIDSIFYGYDLADNLAREFGLDRPSWAAERSSAVPVGKTSLISSASASDAPPSARSCAGTRVRILRPNIPRRHARYRRVANRPSEPIERAGALPAHVLRDLRPRLVDLLLR